MGGPNLPVLVFDGDCGFCTRVATIYERRFAARAGATVAPWQFLDLHELGLTPPDVADHAWWVDAGGVRRRGHAAAAAALRAAGGVWGVVGRLLLVPPLSWLAAAVYRVVAANRHRLPGATPACQVRAGQPRQNRG